MGLVKITYIAAIFSTYSHKPNNEWDIFPLGASLNDAYTIFGFTRLPRQASKLSRGAARQVSQVKTCVKKTLLLTHPGRDHRDKALMIWKNLLFIQHTYTCMYQYAQEKSNHISRPYGWLRIKPYLLLQKGLDSSQTHFFYCKLYY